MVCGCTSFLLGNNFVTLLVLRKHRVLEVRRLTFRFSASMLRSAMRMKIPTREKRALMMFTAILPFTCRMWKERKW